MNIDNPKIWSLTDGSQGMISQTRGLSNEFGNDITEITTEIIFPWKNLQPGLLPTFSWTFKNNLISKNVPDIIISCGRKSVYLSTYLKKKFKNIINIHIQNPKIHLKNFSFIVAPNHDNFKGKNVINSIGALHHFKIDGYSKLKFNIDLNSLVTCIVGGENNHYFFTINEAKILCNKIKSLKEKNSNLKFLVITSRRTTYQIKNFLKKQLEIFSEVWIGEGQNPYEFAIYNSKFFIITSDSTSMISEASISGRPIYVYNLPYKRNSIRFKNFHSEFELLNITRDLLSSNNLEEWSYKRLNESKRIAGIIKERIIQGFYET